MIIRQPEVRVPEEELNPALLRRLERCARVCYKSEDRMQEDGAGKFLQSIVEHGHESVIEHEKITVLFIIDRGVSHELVRHRIGAYSQESTRYCNYSQNKFGGEIAVIEPYFFLDRDNLYRLWEESCRVAEQNYLALLESGASPQEARAVLPNSLKTEIAVTFDIREWRHFFRLRCSPAAHPQMRQVAIPLLLLFQEHLGPLFNGIEYDQTFPRKHYARMILCDDLFQPV